MPKVKTSDPELIALFSEFLERVPIQQEQIESEAVRQYDTAAGLIRRYVSALENFRLAKSDLEAVTAETAEDLRQYHRVTEATMRDKVRILSRDMFEKLAKAETELETAKMMLKLFWERGEMLKALLYARQAEFKALGVTNTADAVSKIQQKWSGKK